MRTRALLLLLAAFPAFADEPTYTQAEVVALVRKLQSFNEREREAFSNELRGLDQENKELARKLDALRGRYLCS